MALKAIMFDLDDTLLWDERSVREAFHETCLIAGTETGVNVEALEEAVRHEARELYESYETFPFTKMIGINPFEGLWANFTGGEQPEFRQLEQLAPIYRKESWRRGLLKLGVDQEELAERLASQFGAERRSRPHVYEETMDTLRHLQGKYKLLLLTNGCPALQQEKLDGVPELSPFFDEIIISGNFGKGKPDPSIFEHALSRLGVQPEESMMVGDKLTTDIRGALSSGIRAVWINRENKENNETYSPNHEIKHLSELEGLIANF